MTRVRRCRRDLAGSLGEGLSVDTALAHALLGAHCAKCFPCAVAQARGHAQESSVDDSGASVSA